MKEKRQIGTVAYHEVVYIPICPATGCRFPRLPARHYAVNFELDLEPGRVHDVVVAIDYTTTVETWLYETFGPLA